MGKSNQEGPLTGNFQRERELRKGSMKGKLIKYSPGEGGGPISNSSGKNTLVSGKREYLKEGERGELPT